MTYQVVNNLGDMEEMPIPLRCIHNNTLILPGTEHIYEIVTCKQCGCPLKQVRDLSDIKLEPWHGISAEAYANRLEEINKEIEVRIYRSTKE